MAIAIRLEMPAKYSLQALQKLHWRKLVHVQSAPDKRVCDETERTAPSYVYSLRRALTFWGYICTGARNLSQTTFFDELNELVFTSIFRS